MPVPSNHDIFTVLIIPHGENCRKIFDSNNLYIRPRSLPYFLNGTPINMLGMSAPAPDFTTSRYFREIDLFPYFQNDWKVMPRLTLNLGLRYEFATNAVGAGGVPLFAILDPLTSTGFTKEVEGKVAFIMDPMKVGERVLEGIRRNDLYIFTHPEFRDGIRSRCDALMAAIPDEEPDPARVAAIGFLLSNPIYSR